MRQAKVGKTKYRKGWRLVSKFPTLTPKWRVWAYGYPALQQHPLIPVVDEWRVGKTGTSEAGIARGGRMVIAGVYRTLQMAYKVKEELDTLRKGYRFISELKPPAWVAEDYHIWNQVRRRVEYTTGTEVYTGHVEIHPESVMWGSGGIVPPGRDGVLKTLARNGCTFSVFHFKGNRNSIKNKRQAEEILKSLGITPQRNKTGKEPIVIKSRTYPNIRLGGDYVLDWFFVEFLHAGHSSLQEKIDKNNEYQKYTLVKVVRREAKYVVVEGEIDNESVFRAVPGIGRLEIETIYFYAPKSYIATLKKTDLPTGLHFPPPLPF